MGEKVEKWEVVANRPQQLTREDGTTQSIRPGDDPVKLKKDRRFQRARQDNDIHRVYVEVEEEGDDDTAESTEDENGGSGDAELAREVAESVTDEETYLESLDLDEATVGKLADEGIETVSDVRETGFEAIETINGIGETRLDNLKDAVEGDESE